MQPGEPRVEVVGEPFGKANEPPVVLILSLGLPVFAVVVWFMVRLFTGRWITDPAPSWGPVPGDGGDATWDDDADDPPVDDPSRSG